MSSTELYFLAIKESNSMQAEQVLQLQFHFEKKKGTEEYASVTQSILLIFITGTLLI
jgi:hypothetical protein